MLLQESKGINKLASFKSSFIVEKIYIPLEIGTRIHIKKSYNIIYNYTSI